MSSPKHVPVLLEEVRECFRPLKIHTFADGTLGAGGHASILLLDHPEIVLFFGFDRDDQAVTLAEERLKDEKKRVCIIQTSFSHVPEELKKRKVHEVDAILLDLGVSSMQLDTGERGFSFSREGPLDMRMDRRQDLTAEIIVNEWSEKRIGHILQTYGDIGRWRMITKLILEERKKRRIRTTGQFVDLLSSVLKRGARPKIHPATPIFQALRIAVNDELGILEKALPEMIGLLRSGGRIGVISFHSGEDRIVKHVFRDFSRKRVTDSGETILPKVKCLTPKPITASGEEIRKNPRSRSAKFRYAEKL